VSQFRLLRIAPIFILACSGLAQNAAEIFTKAPPEVDDALRARIAKFYQAQVDGFPRRAEAIVAEDSKDFFYNMSKPKFLSFEIREIKYSENFTKAKAVIIVETYVMVPGFGNKPMKVPGQTLWKIENGQWCWYIDPDVLNTTPFGKMKAPEGATQTGSAPDLKSGPTPEALGDQVKADKVAVWLRATASGSDQVKIHNGMPGTVRLELRHAQVRGLEIKADRTEIPAGETAILSIQFRAGQGLPPNTLPLEVTVEPINKVLRIMVRFSN